MVFGIEPLSIIEEQIKTLNLSPDESIYRFNIQKNLHSYLDVWSLLDNIWHLKPLKFEYMNTWKSNQEKKRYQRKEVTLQDQKLSNF